MDIKTLENFNLGDAIKFHDKLNPNLWHNNKLKPEVKKQLKVISDDFLSELGVDDLDVIDITVSGSNAAYSYTPHSDLDLHILVDMNKLNNDEIYKELFNAKKNLYNDSHHIKIHGVPVELYIQDSNEPVVSLGEYSIINDKWIKLPTKRRANLDQTATKQKYEKLLTLIKRSLVKPNSEKINDIIKTIKRYRQAGLDKGGEFSPENLAYKILRTQGYIDKLYQLRDKLHSVDLSIEEKLNEEPYEYMPPAAKMSDVNRIYRQLQSNKPKLIWKRQRDIRGSYTDKQLIDMGFIKSRTTGNWGGTQEQWSKFGFLPETSSYNLVAPYKEIEFVCVNPDYNDVLADVQKRFYYILKQTPGVIPLYQDWSHLQKGQYSLSVIYKDPNLRKEILKLAKQFNMSVDLERTVSDNYVDRAIRGEHEGQISEDETLQFAAEKTPIISPYAGIKDTQFRGSISETPDTSGPVGVQPGGWRTYKPRTVEEEYKGPKSINTPGLADAISDWSSMEETVNSIDTILKSPESNPFKKPPTNIKALYRAIVPKNREINQIKTSGKIVAFATDIRGAHEFIHTLDIQDRYVIIKKEFRPQDFLLDYTSLYETYDETSQGMYYLSEHEVWMKNTPYYRSAQKDEVVYDSAKDVAQETKENISGKLSYQGNCTQDDIIDHIFGDVNNFARLVDEYGDEFELNDLVVKYDPKKDIHSFYYKTEQIKELVNPDVVKDGFKHSKTVNNGEYTLTAKTDVYSHDGKSWPSIEVKIYNQDKKQVGFVMFTVRRREEDNEPHLTSMSTSVEPEYRGRGLARMMYQYANELGNDIEPSRIQTQMGRDMWKGLSKHIRRSPSLPEPVIQKPEPKPSFWQRLHKALAEENLSEASGYIPSEKEKNDPRFKTALTVDIKPDTMKKDAKKFGNKISRAGIPPTLKANGKF